MLWPGLALFFFLLPWRNQKSLLYYCKCARNKWKWPFQASGGFDWSFVWSGVVFLSCTQNAINKYESATRLGLWFLMLVWSCNCSPRWVGRATTGAACYGSKSCAPRKKKVCYGNFIWVHLMNWENQRHTSYPIRNKAQRKLIFIKQHSNS